MKKLIINLIHTIMKNKIKLSIIIVLSLIPIISTASKYYWVGGSGNWSDYANHWATTSGGNVFQSHVPSTLDDVVFDANSFTASGQIVTANQTIVYCKDMEWNFVTYTPTFNCIDTSITIKIYGSVKLSPNMNFSFNGHMNFETLSQGKTIQTYSQILPCSVDFSGFGGEWTLLDSLTTIQDLKLNYGTLKSNNQNIRCNNFYALSNAPAGLLLGTSVVSITSITSNWMIRDTLLILDADSSTIKLTGYYWDQAIHTQSLTKQKYNIIEFTSPITYNMQALYMGNVIINKLIFGSDGSISEGSDVFIDSLIGKSWTYIEVWKSKINSAIIYGDFHQDGSFPKDSIINLTVYGDAFIETNSGFSTYSPFEHFFGTAIFNGNLTLGNPDQYPYKSHSKFINCTIYGDGNFLSDSNYFDTLKLTIGRTYTFGYNKTQFINNWFDCFGDPGFPIQLISNTIGQQAMLNISQNYFCSDYLYIRDMRGIGGQNLFVGNNSNNVYNNSGWLFTACNVGINEFNENSPTIFPNPVTQFLYISLPENNNKTEFKIYNLLGQLEFASNLEIQETKLNISRLKDGIYFIDLIGNNKIKRIKFIKE